MVWGGSHCDYNSNNSSDLARALKEGFPGEVTVSQNVRSSDNHLWRPQGQGLWFNFGPSGCSTKPGTYRVGASWVFADWMNEWALGQCPGKTPQHLEKKAWEPQANKNSWARAVRFLKQFLQSKQILQGSSDISYTHAPCGCLWGMCGDGKSSFVVSTGILEKRGERTWWWPEGPTTWARGEAGIIGFWNGPNMVRFVGLCQVCEREAHLIMIAEVTHPSFPFWGNRDKEPFFLCLYLFNCFLFDLNFAKGRKENRNWKIFSFSIYF